jgi:glycosyltransferase involved in cell wall biosynthesis
MKRILVLTELYYPEETSTGYFLTKIAELLAEKFTVKTITAPASKLLKKTKLAKREERNNVEIFRCWGTRFDKNNIAGRIVNFFTQSLGIFLKTLSLANSQDIIFVVTNPPLLPFCALLVKWLKGCRVFLLIHDVYPEVLIATEIFKPSSLLVAITRRTNKILYNNCDRIITLGRDMSAIAQNKLDRRNYERIVCIPNWADTDIIYPIVKQDNPLINKLQLESKFIVLQLGNIGRTHGIEYLVEAAKKLQENSKIKFIVVGSGAKKQWLQEEIERNKLESMEVFPTCDRSELNQYLNLGDIAVISFIPGMAGVSVPSRMYNQMAAGKAIIAIADDRSELALVVEEEQIGWVVRPNDIEQLVNVIQTAVDNPTLCQEMGEKAALVANTKYNFISVKKAYHSLFQESIDSN